MKRILKAMFWLGAFGFWAFQISRIVIDYSQWGIIFY